MKKKWIKVIGIGEEGLDGLVYETRKLIESADVLVGGERHLSKVEVGSEIRVDWSNGIEKALDVISQNSGKWVIVLASGDPLNFGVGKNVIERFGIDSVSVIPAPGAFSLAAARMGWSLPDVKCLTVHGRSIFTVTLHLIEGERLLILSRDGSTPTELATLLVKKGFGLSEITVFQKMGSDDTRVDGIAKDWNYKKLEDLNTIAVFCRATLECNHNFWSRVPGLPDDAYENDGQITKREVRAATLARLSPLPGRVLWDVGAGSGSVGIEWLRCEPSAKVVAIECDSERVGRIRRNAENLGVPSLQVVHGRAPKIFTKITIAPDVIFVGGGVSVLGLLEACWKALRAGGRLVVNGVTTEAEQTLIQFHHKYHSDLIRFSISRSHLIGEIKNYSVLKPMLEVTQLIADKE